MRSPIWLIVAALVLSGCGISEPEPQREMMELDMPVAPYARIDSGYHDPDGARMSEFLQCWTAETRQYASAQGIEWVERYRETAPFPDAFADRLPVSYVNFWQTAPRIGWMGYFDLASHARFYAPGDIALLKDGMRDYYDVFVDLRNDYEGPESSFYAYDRDQSTLGFMGRELDDVLVVGDDGDGEFSSLVFGERSLDGEYQAVHYGPQIFGTRVKSFAHLLVHFYLNDHERFAGRDPSMGHIYAFEGNWNDTCVPLLFDRKEIDTWGAGHW